MVPLGVGKLPFSASPACLGASGTQDTPPGPVASPTGSTGWGAGHGGGVTLRLPPYTGGPLTLLYVANSPRDVAGTWGPRGHNHVHQEAQRVLWGLRMVGDRLGWLKGWGGLAVQPC